MPIVVTTHVNNPKVTLTGPFGAVPHALVDSVDPDAVLADVDRRSELWISNGPRPTDEEMINHINELRMAVGFWRCVGVSLFSRRLHPQKYYDLCGTPHKKFGRMVSNLVNNGAATAVLEGLARDWKKTGWSDFVHEVLRLKSPLMAKEKEYRDAANVILQVGIGWGGMVLGVVGLALSILTVNLPWPGAVHPTRDLPAAAASQPATASSR
jgi:hypothetical protein